MVDIDTINDKLTLTENNGYILTESANWTETFVVNWCNKTECNFNKYLIGTIIRSLGSLLENNRMQLGDLKFECNKQLLAEEHMQNMSSTINMYYIDTVLNRLKLTESHLGLIKNDFAKNKATVILLLNGKNLV